MALRSKKYERIRPWTPAAAKLCVFCKQEYMPTGSMNNEELRVWLLAMLHGVNWRAQPFR